MRLYDFSLPSPFRKGILLNGPKGWGECSPLPGRNRETLEEAKIQLQEIASGRPVEQMYPSVAFALESANTRFENPISVPSAALLMGNKNEIIEKAHFAEKNGFTSAKLKINRVNFQEAIELAHSLKSTFRLRIDGNQCWTLDDAFRFCDHFSTNDFEYIEEPLKNPRLLDQFPFPYALDESLSSIKIDGAAAIIIKPMVIGPNWRELAKDAEQKKIPIVFGSSFESGIGLSHIGYLSHVYTGHQLIPGLGTHLYLKEDLIKNPPHYQEGHIHLSLGFSIDFFRNSL